MTTSKPRETVGRPVVKVVLPKDDAQGMATICSKDRKVVMEVGAGAVSKRFRPGEREAYFKSELFEDGILEIGDRVPTPVPAW